MDAPIDHAVFLGFRYSGSSRGWNRHGYTDDGSGAYSCAYHQGADQDFRAKIIPNPGPEERKIRFKL